MDTAAHIAQAEMFGAHNYAPLPVVIASGQGAWVTDVEGRRYLDCLAAYSALNFGHRHPTLVAAAHAQLDRLTLTSRAFGNDRLGEFCELLAQRGVLAKETHGSTLRMAPPLVITPEELDHAVDELAAVLADLSRRR